MKRLPPLFARTQPLTRTAYAAQYASAARAALAVLAGLPQPVRALGRHPARRVIEPAKEPS